MQHLKNPQLFRQQVFINGKWLDAANQKTLTVENPANAEIIGAVPDCAQAETQYAIKVASSAFKTWKQLTAKARSDLMWRWAELIDENKTDLAMIMTLEQGKPLAEATGEIDYANSFIKWFAEEARRAYGDIIPANKAQQQLLVIKQPVGVVAAITPWNFPAAMITRKIAPALAVGCTVVVKPDSQTPFTALALALLAEQAGFPAGVINVLTGDAKIIGAEMTSNPLVHKLSFTGSTTVGRLLMAQSASTLKKLSLELGGNAPFIVFADADLDAAVSGAIQSKFRNSGQTCVCANRILVEDKIYDAFTEKFVQAVKSLKVGDGRDAGVTQGPLISQKALEKVQKHIEDAVSKGAKILLGGKSHALGGLFFEPTVLINANANMLLAKEETFGPVAPLFKFHTEDEAIQMANDTEFGLASYFYTRDLARSWRVSSALEYGMVGVNAGILSTEVAPFGGIKQSGVGREGSKYGTDDYLELKYVCVNT